MRVRQGIFNRLQHPLTIAQYVMIPEPKYPITALHKEFRSSRIGADLRGMVATIKFDYKPMRRTTEVHNVRTDRVLAAKLRVLELSVSQLPPEYSLTVGLSPAKSTGKS